MSGRYGKIHGHARTDARPMTPTYQCWCNMKQRCYSHKHKSYADYGGRGIAVCKRWHNFVNFLADMGIKPVGMSLGRKNNDRGYGPSNCEWQTDEQQRANTRQSHVIEFDGEKLPLFVWAERLGLSQDTLHKRLNRYGWSVRRALTTPGRNMKNSICRWVAP